MRVVLIIVLLCSVSRRMAMLASLGMPTSLRHIF